MSTFGEGSKEAEVKNDLHLTLRNLHEYDGFTWLQIIKMVTEVLKVIMDRAIYEEKHNQ